MPPPQKKYQRRRLAGTYTCISIVKFRSLLQRSYTFCDLKLRRLLNSKFQWRIVYIEKCRQISSFSKELVQRLSLSLSLALHLTDTII